LGGLDLKQVFCDGFKIILKIKVTIYSYKAVFVLFKVSLLASRRLSQVFWYLVCFLEFIASQKLASGAGSGSLNKGSFTNVINFLACPIPLHPIVEWDRRGK